VSKFIVGLTGGIGSGKTTVANLFAEQGVALVDADLVARQVVELGTVGLDAIVEHFGDKILTSSGQLDRAALRQRVFIAPQEREWLNALLHPMIRAEMLRQVEKANSDYVIMVVPLLFENGLDSLVNRSLVVDVPPETQVARTRARDGSDADLVKNIIATQIDRAGRLARADDVIDNQGEISGIRCAVLALHQKYLQLAANA
jgi:dephospho-CoA kinase